MTETVTVHYGWIKPEVTKSFSTWGGFLNGDLDSIDALLWSINGQVSAHNLVVSRGPDGGDDGTISFSNNGGTQLRWLLGETSEAEGSGNVGTNFFLNAYDNSGVYLGQAFEAVRSDQTVAFRKAVTVGTTLTVTGAATIGGMATVASLGVSGNAGVSGAFGVTGNASVGSLTVVSSAGISGDLGVSGKANVTGDITGSSGNISVQAQSGGNSNCWFVRNDGLNMGVVYYTHATQVIALQNMVGGGQATIDGVANFKVNGNALKPGGGAWLDSSDARVKTVTGAYSSGLDQVVKLNPVKFRYRGNDGDAHALVKGKEFIGLVADDAMRAMPEMVSLSDGEIDGRKVNDLKMLDPTALLYALVNCVRELKAEIEALKATR